MIDAKSVFDVFEAEHDSKYCSHLTFNNQEYKEILLKELQDISITSTGLFLFKEHLADQILNRSHIVIHYSEIPEMINELSKYAETVEIINGLMCGLMRASKICEIKTGEMK